MQLTRLLEIQPGVTAVIGSGGKTTLLRTLGEELSAAGHRVLLCSTTKIFPFADVETLVSPMEEQLRSAFQSRHLLCAGAPVGNTGKLTAPDIPMGDLARLADYVLVEADGSAGRPLKAHADHEPVIPPEANQTVCLVGVSGFGLPVSEAAHRPERFAALADIGMEDPATLEATARVLLVEHLADRYFFNQADTPERWEWARRCGELLPWYCAVGALRKGVYGRCSL